MGAGTHGKGVLVRPLVPLAHVLVLVRVPHLDLNRAPYGLYGVKYIGLVPLGATHLDLDHAPICFVWC